MFLWALGALVLILIVGGIALQIAISRNGPAVLSGVDKLTGGSGGAALRATISTGEHPSQKLIIWGPEDRNPNDPPLPVLGFVHGGSWRSGDPIDYGFIGRAFVPEGFVVALVGYRLVKDGTPDGVYPAMLEDTAQAIAIVQDDIEQYGGDPSRIAIAGHSAGAYNVVMTALEHQWLGRLGKDANAIAGVIGLSGPYDFFPYDSDSTKAAFGPSDADEATQPLNHIRADAPPMLLIHGEKDALVGVHNSQKLAAAISEAGGTATLKTYPEMTHNDPLISIAAPWRGNRDIVETIADFARNAKPAKQSETAQASEVQ